MGKRKHPNQEKHDTAKKRVRNGRKKHDIGKIEIVESKKHSGVADIISASPSTDTVKVRAKKNGKMTTKRVQIELKTTKTAKIKPVDDK